MSKVVQRVKNLFRKDPRPQQLSSNRNYGTAEEEETLDTVTKPSYSMDEDAESVGQYNIREETQLREQTRDTVKSFDTARSGDAYGSGSTLPGDQLNSANAQYRASSSGFISNIPPINTKKSSPNADSDSTRKSGSPPLSRVEDEISRPALNSTSKTTYNQFSPVSGYPTDMNNNQSSSFPPNNNFPSSNGDFPSTTNFNQSKPLPPLINNSPKSFGSSPPGMNLNPPAPGPQSSLGGFPPGMNLNPPTSAPQSSLGGFPPGMNLNPPTSAFGGFPPGMNLNPPAPTPSAFGGFPPGMNLNQPQPSTNYSQSQMNNLPPGTNNNQISSPFGYSTGINSQLSHPMNDSNNFVNHQQRSLVKQQQQQLRSSNSDNISLLELDYPIEKVLIDANIPQAVAIKINDAVEKDRLGNAYHVHRYTFEPSSQHISFSDNKNNHRYSARKPSHVGSRHIREILEDDEPSAFDDSTHRKRSHKYSKQRFRYNPETKLNQYLDDILHQSGNFVVHTQNFDHLQRVLNPSQTFNQFLPIQSSINHVPFITDNVEQPVFYYTAQALPNDPMRIH